MKLIEENGDLFSVHDKYALAHCISLDCAMGAGIAKDFDSRFPDMKLDLLHTIESNNLTHPFTIAYIYDDLNIFNLITKQKYWNKPTYETITECIKQLVWFCKERNIKYLAIPKIGCGLDRLSWNKVKSIVEKEFNDLDIEIVVRYL